MAEAYAVDSTRVQAMDDQLWRRVGVTQAFEILLVEAALVSPALPADVSKTASQKLSGGAARFWDLSVAQLQRDLCRRRILALTDGQLQAHPEFVEKLERVLDSHEQGVSRVAPTPGVTTEQVLKEAEARAKQDAQKKASAKRKPKASPTPKSSVSATPRKRQSNEDETVTTIKTVATKSVTMSASQVDYKKLFTSNRLNRLLDHLDDTRLTVSQIAKRLDLAGRGLEAFLEVINEVQITRVSRDNIVELHWRGRELVRTVGVDRRLAVLDLVKELRELKAPKED